MYYIYRNIYDIMSDVFYEMSKVTIKPVVNYTVLQIFLISSLNFTLVVAFCTVVGNISHTFTPRILDSFHVSIKWVVLASTKQEAAHTQSAKVSTWYTLWHFGVLLVRIGQLES